jgi:hypothetical protein
MDTATIFVVDGGKLNAPTDHDTRARREREIRAYMYNGWEIVGWGRAPETSGLADYTGFYLEGPASGGFGADALSARLHSGLLANHIAG